MIDQIETRPQKTLEFEMKKQKQVFSFSQPLNLSEEGKWLLAVSSSAATNSVLNITDENNTFSNSIPGRWRIINYLPNGIIDKLKEILKPRSDNDIKLQVEELGKRRNQVKIGDKIINYLNLILVKMTCLKN